MSKAAIVILAAGSGSRVGAEVNKILLDLGSHPVIAHSVITALQVPDVAAVVLVARPGEEGAIAEAVTPVIGDREVLLIAGGEERQDSERAALDVLRPRVTSGEVDVIAIHDGARPFASVELYQAVISTARTHGGAIPGVPLSSVLTTDLKPVEGTLVGVQTPQAFRATALLAAYDRGGNTATDTAAALADDVVVRAVPGTSHNFKITWPEDVRAAERLIRGS
ncbi:2-C-methyl-D-erythritol 4-phosphate cytidylyltransferase [Nocardioides baekrokdamisoli]|uniref:2-C-methyl-D-erythritol 4-phosphate cytidylyltransferase n=1 Tax=Nocardioides baekrokdamisoli TaxID=1804624 RepID=A0A3G9IXB8_9ACTN|nr:2-C-methyl-D-erythritol 4-phosphate cytidylyltransferase [Nocardioides baekrokdamisoli]BBH17033.1 2-C-methyl-D-erythritol 4-phosphate cytidylyltransferase [Nocardioides baekrokdamisoli]